MKILYAIQGTGNGHVCRAIEIVPLLQKHHEVDVLLSGSQADIPLPFMVKYRFNGLSFVFGKSGGIDLFETYKKGSLKRLFREINSLPVQDYDLVINDFEPVSAWACFQKNKACISLSHQAAVLNKHAPKSMKADPVGKAILKKYAPTTSQYGFHFKAYSDQVYTPVIRAQVRALQPTNKPHYTVYLPAYNDKRIIRILKECSNVQWQVFSKHNKKETSFKNIRIMPLSNDGFVQSMASASGVLCGAGFETPAEALFLKKKLMVIPMKGQYEQQCNAAALKEMGVPVIKKLKKKNIAAIDAWIKSGDIIPVHYPDETEAILDKLLRDHSPNYQQQPMQAGKKIYRFKKFRQFLVMKIQSQLLSQLFL